MSMRERRESILTEPERTGDTITAVCARHGIARSTFYAWRARFLAAGPAGLDERSHRPLNSPRRMDADLEELICRMRKDHPRWGARRIHHELLRREIAPPAVSSIHQALRRNHLVASQPRKKPRSLLRRFERPEPNELWQIDATEIVLAKGKRAWVIDVLDDHARFVLAAIACRTPTAETTWQAFETAARRFGLPQAVLSDNHMLFTGRFLGYRAAFEQRLQRLGVRHLTSAPGHPQTQGKIERVHRTLKEWLAEKGPIANVSQLQKRLDGFRHHYNVYRPNQALDGLAPGQRYRKSPRVYKLRRDLEPAYPVDAITRRVDQRGRCQFDYNQIYVGSEWAHCLVQVVSRGGRLSVFHGDRLLTTVPYLTEGGLHRVVRPPAKATAR